MQKSERGFKMDIKSFLSCVSESFIWPNPPPHRKYSDYFLRRAGVWIIFALHSTQQWRTCHVMILWQYL